ncbi:LOW QUALITY PROTEIN: cytochrome P450 2C5-like [Erythrolamprus reginae]|uniref:LOW QUALITY PROTEIN: cytochrome P450 2C5-like n=1 Tax=Erythrolamprus reginae TaxID=121349 RepID=UPI00396C65EA
MQAELIPGTIILFIIFLLTFWAFRFHQARGRLPPGPRPWLFLGNLLQKDVLPLYKHYPKLLKKYGPVFTVWLGTKPMVALCGCETVRDALVTHNEEFSGRPPVVLFDEITKGYGIIGEHKRWKIIRRFTLTTLRNFGMGKKSMADRILEEVHCLVGKISTFEGQPFDILPTITASVSNVLCYVLFGNRYSYEDKTITELLEILEEFNIFFLSAPGVLYSTLPNIMKFLPGPHKKLFSDCNKVCDFIRNKMEAHKKTLDPENPRDFIDCFLLKLEKEQDSSIICSEDLVMSVFDLFLAGSQSTSNAISFGLITLAYFPHIQAKAQQEIDEVVGANRAPTLENRIEMTYIKALLHEILRYLQGEIENLPHMTTQDVNFRGHFILRVSFLKELTACFFMGKIHFCYLCFLVSLKGTYVLPLWFSVHFDPLCWEDPEKFDPGHFLNEKGEFQKNDAYLPFSAGKRTCPGEGLADMEMFLFFVILLQHFTFELTIDPKEINLEALFTELRKNGKHRYLRAIKRKI